MQIIVKKNTPRIFTVTPYLNSRGWTVDGDVATHESFIEGDIDFPRYRLIKDNVYEYSIYVDEIENGYVALIASGTEINRITTAGYLQGTFTAEDNGTISIRSDADATVNQLQIKLTDDGNPNLDNSTITWSEDRKRWITFKDFIPDMGFSMYTKLYTVKDGYLYSHDNDILFNNFYGVQYESRLKFPIASAGVKTYQSIAIHSNKVMGTTEDGITTQLGHISDLIVEDFTTKNGIHYANFLRDKLTDVVTGDRLKGRYVVIELVDQESTKLQIFKINVKSSVITPNE